MSRWSSLFTLTSQSFWLWFGGIWFVVGVPFLCGGLYAGYHTVTLHDRLQKEGQVAQGMVLIKSIDSSSGTKGNRNSTYSVTYRFTTADGQVVKDRAQVGVETWDRLVEREPIQVTYVPYAPQLHRVEGQIPDWVLVAILTILGGIFTLLGGFILLRALSQRRRARHLLHDGLIIQGTVVSVGPGNLSINGIPQWTIHYRYRDPRGRTHRGTSGLLSPEEAQAWHIQDSGTVRVDPQQPGESLWVGKG